LPARIAVELPRYQPGLFFILTEPTLQEQFRPVGIGLRNQAISLIEVF